MRAVIAGGGVGGLAAAIALRQAGIEVRVLEQAESLRGGGAGLWLWPNALAALASLDVLSEVRAAGRAQTCSWIRSRRGRRLARIEAVDPAGEPAESLTIQRGALLSILTRRLGPSVLRTDARLVAILDGETVGARLADSDTEHGDLLIGADGVHSVVREALFGHSTVGEARFEAFRAIVAFPGAPEEAVVYWGRGARFGLMPLAGGVVNWYASRAPGAAAQPAPALAAQFQDWPPVVRAAIDATLPGDIRVDRVDARPPLQRWSRGRVTLLGDAAHPMTPSLGQGACQALEDAVVLGRSLASQGDIPRALQDYERRRRPRAARVAARSLRMDRLIQMTSPPLCALRDLAVSAVPGAVLRRMLADLWHFDPEES
jgi:2-polyprenyl-6-methoxyphenol hydroxylase-like FAD-dependent oxidoreductase